MIKFIITFFTTLFILSSVNADDVTTYDNLVKANKSPENWLTYGGTLDGQRYSRLKQINKKKC